MRWSCRVANRLLILFIVGGTVTLSVLSGVPAAAAPPDDVNAYPPEVREFLETTYLGHAAEFPDPGEPYVVLKKYVERDTHKYLRGDVPQLQELDREIKEWQGTSMGTYLENSYGAFLRRQRRKRGSEQPTTETLSVPQALPSLYIVKVQG